MSVPGRLRIHLATRVWWRWCDGADDFEPLRHGLSFARVELDHRRTLSTARLVFAGRDHMADFGWASRAGRRADVGLDLLEGDRLLIFCSRLAVWGIDDGFEVDLVRPLRTQGPFAISRGGPPRAVALPCVERHRRR